MARPRNAKAEVRGRKRLAPETPEAVANLFLRLVESTGTEVGVSIIVGGTMIQGILTPWTRYAEWLTKTTRAAMKAGGNIPVGPVDPISPEEAKRVANSWKKAVGNATAEEQMDIQIPFFALRNAVVLTTNPMLRPSYPFLAVQASAVDAIALGTTEEGLK